MKSSINVNGKILNLNTPKIMGVLNATPDSFFEGSRIARLEDQVLAMIREGVDIIDVGGYSTRPGADVIDLNEELDRVLPVIEKIKSIAPQMPLSIDTFRGKVAELSVEAGANIVNDVSGGNLDEQMFDIVALLNVPYILGHMRGDPGNMQSQNKYQDLLTDVLTDLQAKCSILNGMGVKDILVDPGFGFAKSRLQNFELFKELEQFSILNHPIVVGFSRKSMIWKTLGVGADESLNGTTVLNSVAMKKEIGIIRVHDVKEVFEARKLLIFNQFNP